MLDSLLSEVITIITSHLVRNWPQDCRAGKEMPESKLRVWSFLPDGQKGPKTGLAGLSPALEA